MHPYLSREATGVPRGPSKRTEYYSKAKSTLAAQKLNIQRETSHFLHFQRLVISIVRAFLVLSRPSLRYMHHPTSSSLHTLLR